MVSQEQERMIYLSVADNIQITVASGKNGKFYPLIDISDLSSLITVPETQQLQIKSIQIDLFAASVDFFKVIPIFILTTDSDLTSDANLDLHDLTSELEESANGPIEYYIQNSSTTKPYAVDSDDGTIYSIINRRIVFPTKIVKRWEKADRTGADDTLYAFLALACISAEGKTLSLKYQAEMKYTLRTRKLPV